MFTFRYKALDKRKEEIRLLHLLPGLPGDPLKLHIVHVPFSKAKELKYEALSYTWGSEEDLQPVQLSRLSRPRLLQRVRRAAKDSSNIFDEADAGTLFVTLNLKAALSRLRQPDRMLRLWVDAICIDQRNTAEKAIEVNRMGDIYRYAGSVLVWLGPASHDSTLAMDTLKTVVDHIKSLGEGSNLQYKINRVGHRYPWSGNSSEGLHARRSAVGSLLQRPWFGRLWIWQEIILTTNAIMVCGDAVLPYERFRRAILMAVGELSHGEVLYGCIDEKSAEPIRRIAKMPRQSPELSILLAFTKYAICKNPRDRIFALRSLMAPDLQAAIVPNYDKTPEDVFRDTILSDIRVRGTLELLTWCEMPFPLDWQSSWVPSLSTPRMTPSISFASACSLCKAEAQYNGRNRLSLEGVHATTISDVICAFQKEGSVRDLSILLQKFAKDLFTDVTEEKYQTTLAASLISLVSCNQYALEYVDTCASQISENLLPSLLEFLEADLSTASPAQPAQLHFPESGFDQLRGRAIFKTEDGHLGLGPAALQVGDHIGIFLGGNVPFILRVVNGTTNNYQVVGMTFIRELMDKQAFLGPLPSSITAWWSVSHGIPSSFYYYNGVATEEDPRLGPLPPGCKLIEVDVYQSAGVSNIAPGFESLPTVRRKIRWPKGVQFDTRMSSSSLRARGVDLKTFVLV